MLRNVRSTNGNLEVSEAESDRLEALIDAGKTVRESYILDEAGQKDYRIQVVKYVDAEQTRFAMRYDDPASVEIEDTADQDEAEARYEETVRASWSNMIRFEDDLFDASDVDGVGVRNP